MCQSKAQGGRRCSTHLIATSSKTAGATIKLLTKATSPEQVRAIAYKASIQLDDEPGLDPRERTAAKQLVEALKNRKLTTRFGGNDAVRKATRMKVETLKIAVATAQRARGRKNEADLNPTVTVVGETLKPALKEIHHDLYALNKAMRDGDTAGIDKAIENLQSAADRQVTNPRLREAIDVYLRNQRNRFVWPNMLPDWAVINDAATDISRITEFGE